MTRLKNITLSSVALLMFDTTTPFVNGSPQDVLLVLAPGADVDETFWRVTDQHSPSYNDTLINEYIQNNILTRLI